MTNHPPSAMLCHQTCDSIACEMTSTHVECDIQSYQLLV